MLDFIRNLTKTEAERLDERISGYLDGTLSGPDRARLERRMDSDPALRSQIRQMQALRQAMRRLPRRRVPRNFTLDPAQVGAFSREPAWTPYPILRSATVVAALLLAMLLVFDLGFYRGGLAQPAAETVFAPEMMAADEAADIVEELPAEGDLGEAVESAMEEAPPAITLEMEAAPVEAEVVEAEAVAEEAPLRQELSEPMAAEILEEAAAETGEATRSALGGQTLPEEGDEAALAAPTPVVETTQAPPTATAIVPTIAPTVTPLPLPTITAAPLPASEASSDVIEPEAPTEGLNPLLLAELVLGAGTLLLVLLTWLYRRRL